MVVEKLFRLFRAKALNHTPSILRNTLYVNRIRKPEPLRNSVGRKQILKKDRKSPRARHLLQVPECLRERYSFS